jgi:hypothetical protein
MVSKIGLDLNYLNNIPDLTINLSNTSKQIFTDVPEISNTITNHWLGYFILLALFIVMYWDLSDKTPLQNFGYSDVRGASISFSISSLIGVTLIEIGYITEFKAVAFVVTMSLIGALFIEFYENKVASD